MVGTTAGLGWLLILTAPLADPAAANLPSREQLLFMLEFSDAQGEFIDPFDIQSPGDDEELIEAKPAEQPGADSEGHADARDG